VEWRYRVSARATAEEALAFHIDGLVEDGEAIPEASSLEEVIPIPTTDPALRCWLL
jgi:predicted RNase H-like HicB family nuclease